MLNYNIIKLTPENYHKCSNIWDMESKPELSKYFYDELVSGNRIIYIYTVNNEYLGEASLVLERNDSDYSIPGQRIYFSRKKVAVIKVLAVL